MSSEREREREGESFVMLFHDADIPKLVQAALGHLLTLRYDQVVSFARCDDLPGDAVGEPVT